MKILQKMSPDKTTELTGFMENRNRSGKEVRRAQAIMLVEEGLDNYFIKKMTKYNKKYALKLRTKYLKKGIEALHDRGGKKPRALLTAAQRAEIIEIVGTSTPKKFDFDSDYWTTSILSRFIEKRYHVKYKSKTSICIIFKLAKFSYHKPDMQYQKRNQELIDVWRKKYHDLISEALQDNKTTLLCLDEMMLSTQTTTQKIWLPKGEFPKIDVAINRKTRCVYGALNIKNHRAHAMKTERANSQGSRKFLDYLGNLYPGIRIMIIWDNASWHKSVEIKEYLKTTKHNFHLVNFPPYSPDLNPQEHVWKAGRSHVTHNTFITDIDKTTDLLIDYFNKTSFDYSFSVIR